MLPDEVLLEIYDFHMMQFTEKGKERGYRYLKGRMALWLTLVHVCRRWRSVVFGSPRRLNLQRVCSTRTPKDTLDVWPALPLAIDDVTFRKKGFVALLERSELVRRITQIELQNVHLGDISKAMEVPIPELTDLRLHSTGETPLSDSFLGGSAPRLQVLIFDHVPIPGLPKLLSSATHLTDLHLEDIPHSGYISPEAMVACLSLLTSLDRLSLEFRSLQSRPNRESRRHPPSTRTLLPSLTRFWFKAHSEYLENLMARIDAPRLNFFRITFSNDIIFDTPQFTRLFRDTTTFNAFNEARVLFGEAIASIRLSLASEASGDGELNMNILCRELDRQFSFLEQVCASSLSPLPTLEDLYIDEYPYWRRAWEDNIDNASWLELLHPFTTVKNLFLSKNIAPRVVPALHELVEGRTTEVLPTLQNVFIEELQPSESGPVQEGVGKLVAARQLTGHPIVVSCWDRYPQGYPSRPQVPRELDLSSNALYINPEKLAQLGLPSPVTLVPKSGHLTTTSEFLPDSVAASATSTRPVEIDSFPSSEEGLTTAHIDIDLPLESFADRLGPIEFDLEGFDNTTTTGGDDSSPPLPPEAFHGATTTDGNSEGSVTSPPFYMTIDTGTIDMLELEVLNMDWETGSQAEGENAAVDT